MRWEDNRAETTAWPSGCVEDQQTVRGTVFQTLECQLPWSGAKERRSNWCRISTFTQADLSVERPSPWGGTGCSGRRLRQNRNRPSTIRTCSQRLESYRRTMVSVRPNRRGGAVAGREKKGDLTYRSAPAARSSSPEPGSVERARYPQAWPRSGGKQRPVAHRSTGQKCEGAPTSAIVSLRSGSARASLVRWSDLEGLPRAGRPIFRLPQSGRDMSSALAGKPKRDSSLSA